MDHNALVRYARNISLAEIGEAGQEKLLASKVLVIGAGGLGSPLLYYLAAAGIGTIGVVDDDRVALNNLQRQIIHETDDIGRPKVQSAADALSLLNPDIAVVPHLLRLDASNAEELIAGYDMVADGCDNFETRFLVNQICRQLEKTLVSAAVIGFTGQLYTFKSHLGGNLPCYQCLYPEPPAAGATPPCSQAGVLGSVAGMLGSWQATEVIKELLGIGESLAGQMLMFDALGANTRKLQLPRNPACPGCGDDG